MEKPRRLCPPAALLAAAALAFSHAAPGADSPFAFREISPASLQLSENGQPVFVYNFGGILADGAPEATRRSTYLHPVYAPDGTVLTDDFNPNHPHHRGIFWAWEVVAFDDQTNDVWTVKGFRQKFVRWEARETPGATARLTVENGWRMRHAFALLNVSYPGPELLTLQPGKPLVLKYRVILSSGKAAGAEE